MHNATDNDSQVKIFTAHRQLQRQTNKGLFTSRRSEVLQVRTKLGGLEAPESIKAHFHKMSLKQDCPDYRTRRRACSLCF